MSENIGRYAQIKNGDNEVINVIKMTSSFSLEGFYFTPVKDGESCEEGAYYNKDDGYYYIEAYFSNKCGAISNRGV